MRARKPSQKALDIAAASRLYDEEGAVAAPAPKKKASTSRPKASTKKVYSQYDDESEEVTTYRPKPKAAAAAKGFAPAPSANDFDIPKAYCVCLGDDDSTPMIQCEGCENWFHFRCIDLHEDEAKRIKKYFCENCNLAGLGETKYFGQGGSPSPIPEEDAQDQTYESAGEPSPSESDIDEENEVVATTTSPKRRASGAAAKRSRKRIKAEGTTDEDSDDDDDVYTGEGDPVVPKEVREKPKKKASRSTAEKRDKLEAMAAVRRQSGGGTGGGGGSRITTDPQAVRTRQGVKTQLARAFADIYAKAPEGTVRLDIDAVEQELFTLTAEVDPAGALAPRTRYTAKFRSLFQNLRSNAYLRSRLSGEASDDPLTAHVLVNMAAEDLMTPEQRALAQQIQEKSMRDSIKAAIEAPKAKVTHKGEEVIDELATSDSRVPDMARARQSSFAGSPPPPAGSPAPSLPSSHARQSSGGGHQRTFSPTQSSPSTFMAPPSLARSVSGPSIMPEDVGGEAIAENGPVVEEPPRDDAAAAMLKAGSPTMRTSFDLDSIWGSFKSPTVDQSPPAAEPKAEDDMDVDDSPDDGSKKADEDDDAEEAFPEFQPPSRDRDNDADLDAILNPDGPPAAAPKSAANDAPSTSAPAAAATAAGAPPSEMQIPIERLAPVWSGTVDSPDECSFPIFAVQVAGRLLGTHQDMWSRILPANLLRIEGRLATQVGSEYLVQNTFSSSRELVVLALLPDLSGPSILFPDKPSASRAQADHAQLISSLSSRKRIAVILPQERHKKAVKDIYILPLLRKEPIPDFVELLEAHALGEGKERDKDLLLLVAVLQKGTLPPPVFETVARPPASAPAAPPASVPTSMPPNVDPAAIQALLQQPQLLQSLAAQMPPQQVSNAPLMPPQQQINTLLSHLDPSVLGALLKHPPPPPSGHAQSPLGPSGQFSPPYPGNQSPPQSSMPMGMQMNPERLRMMAHDDGDRGGRGRPPSGGGGYPRGGGGGGPPRRGGSRDYGGYR